MKQEGYLMIDHRASPGLPEDVAIAAGFDPKQVAAGKLMECATYTCNHCRGVVQMNVFRTRERGYCQRCNSFICDYCHELTKHPQYKHVDYDQRVDITREAFETSRPLVLTLT